MTEIIIIAALAKNRVIGKDQSLPWNLPEDLKYFKETTIGNAVIMGRRTFESIGGGKALPERLNIILSRSLHEIDGSYVSRSLEEAVQLCEDKGYNKIFIIGGSSVYAEALGRATKMILSEIPEEYDGNVFFPEFGEEWKEVSRDKREGFDIVTYHKE
ncbi:TPA: dihydrofolate reductase [archaeon]|nr:dihydrofolate reductase [Candidatus Undinarchaeales archaeon SRR5007147.bin71]